MKNFWSALAAILLLVNAASASKHSFCYETKYAELLQMSMLFYNAQAAGRTGSHVNEHNPIPWAGHNRIPADENITVSYTPPGGVISTFQANLTGGHMSDGTSVKNTYLEAYSINMLAYGYLEFPHGYRDAKQEQHLLKTLDWGIDYLERCHSKANAGELWNHGHFLYAQVQSDVPAEQYWGAPEFIEQDLISTGPTQPGNRVATYLDQSQPGTDYFAMVAAAYASVAKVYRRLGHRVEKGRALEDEAKRLLRIAEGNLVCSLSSIPSLEFGNCRLDDVLSWAHMWVYEASGDSHHLKKAIELYNSACNVGGTFTSCNSRTTLSWKHLALGTSLLLQKAWYRHFVESSRTAAIVEPESSSLSSAWAQFIDGSLDWLPAWVEHWFTESTTARRTSDGLILPARVCGGTTPYAMNSAFVVFVMIKHPEMSKHKTHEWREVAMRQVQIALGRNKHRMSYMVGNKHPYYHAKPHHTKFPVRVYSAQATGNWDAVYAPTFPVRNRHVLAGALVSGPCGIASTYRDRRVKVYNGVGVHYNALFSGVLAHLANHCDDKPNHEMLAHPNHYLQKLDKHTIVEKRDRLDYFATAKVLTCDAVNGQTIVSVRIHDHRGWFPKTSKKLGFNYYMRRVKSPQDVLVIAYDAATGSPLLTSGVNGYNDDYDYVQAQNLDHMSFAGGFPYSVQDVILNITCGQPGNPCKINCTRDWSAKHLNTVDYEFAKDIYGIRFDSEKRHIFGEKPSIKSTNMRCNGHGYVKHHHNAKKNITTWSCECYAGWAGPRCEAAYKNCTPKCNSHTHRCDHVQGICVPKPNHHEVVGNCSVSLFVSASEVSATCKDNRTNNICKCDLVVVNITGVIKNTGKVAARDVEAVFDLGDKLFFEGHHGHRHHYESHGKQLVVKVSGTEEVAPNSVYTEQFNFVLSSKHGCGRNRNMNSYTYAAMVVKKIMVKQCVAA